MSIARIITRNPESTENLAAYLRARGYEVVYGDPEAPQCYSEDLTISVEACSSRVEALTRANDIASSRNCDVFVAEGVVDQLQLRRFANRSEGYTAPLGVPTETVRKLEAAVTHPDSYKPELPEPAKRARVARPNPVRQILNSEALSSVAAAMGRQIQHLRGMQADFRLAGEKALQKCKELALWGEARTAEFAKRREARQATRSAAKQQALRVKAQRQMAEVSTRKAATESRTRRYQRDWKLLFTGSAIAALLMLFVVALFMAHAPASSPRLKREQAFDGARAVSTGTQIRSSADNARPLSVPIQSAAASPSVRRSEDPELKVVDHDAVSAPAAKVVTHKPRHRNSDQNADAEPGVTVRYFSRPAPPAAAKTTPGVKHYSDLN